MLEFEHDIEESWDAKQLLINKKIARIHGIDTALLFSLLTEHHLVQQQCNKLFEGKSVIRAAFIKEFLNIKRKRFETMIKNIAACDLLKNVLRLSHKRGSKYYMVDINPKYLERFKNSAAYIERTRSNNNVILF